MADHSFENSIEHATQAIKDGAVVFQKYTCWKCGERLTMEEPNRFYTHGSCDKCGSITNILLHGMNYMALFGSDPDKLQDTFGKGIKELVVVDCRKDPAARRAR